MEVTKDATFKREPNRPVRGNGHGRPGNGRFTDNATWASVPEEELAAFTVRVVNSGACVLYSKSSDGGVLSLTVIYGGERWRAFPRSGADALVAMRDICDDLGI